MPKARSYCPIHQNGDTHFHSLRQVSDQFRVPPNRIIKLWEDGWVTAAGRDKDKLPVFGKSQLEQVRGMLEACGDV